jgi:pyridoxamine 5'-phosphate oxidase
VNNEQWSSGNPFEHFQRLYSEALEKESFDATRAALATVDPEGQPAVRFVLVRGMDSRGFVFYTDYRSRKASHLRENPKAALAWHWASIGVQVRVEGGVEIADAELANQYFLGRGRGSQLGAWASVQSSPLESRDQLQQQCELVEARFEDKVITRPPHWGGYRISPHRVEFWFDRDDRLHDRFDYVKDGATWSVSRLSP